MVELEKFALFPANERMAGDDWAVSHPCPRHPNTNARPAAPDNHDAERIRERLPKRLQELREPMALSNVRPAS